MPPWQAKALAEQVFSRIPAGHQVNYLFQRHLTHGLPLSEAELREVVEIARQHVRGLSRRSTIPVADGRFFEFGAGWDLHIAQLLYCFGIDHQIVVDLRDLLRPDLVFDIRDRLQRIDFEFPRRPPPGHVLGDYLAAIGVDYRAPADARATGLPPGSVDFVTSTNTLEHIPPAEIHAILTECRRLLGDHGVMSFQIDYRDHYSYFDHRLSAYNFLQYSEPRWRWYNPPLHFQNRLRHPEYLDLFAATGFEVVDIDVAEPTDDDRRTIESLDLDAAFWRYGIDEVGRQGAVVVLRPT